MGPPHGASAVVHPKVPPELPQPTGGGRYPQPRRGLLGTKLANAVRRRCAMGSQMRRTACTATSASHSGHRPSPAATTRASSVPRQGSRQAGHSDQSASATRLPEARQKGSAAWQEAQSRAVSGPGAPQNRHSHWASGGSASPLHGTPTWCGWGRDSVRARYNGELTTHAGRRGHSSHARDCA